MGKGNRLRQDRRLVQRKAANEAALLRNTRRRAVELGAAEGRRRGCLFCRKADGGFTSEEHILPEGLGNTEKILPVGVVCDRCNHGVLSQLDEALYDFLPIELLRTWQGIPSKRGELPAFKFDNGSMRCVRPGEISLALDSAKGQPKPRPAGSGGVNWGFTAQRHDMTPKRLRNIQRALLKLVVEFAWVDLGEASALSRTFDHVRERVLGKKRPGYLVFPEKIEPRDEVEIQYEPGIRNADQHPVFGIVASFWGFPVFTDSLFPGPQRQLPPGWLLQPFPA